MSRAQNQINESAGSADEARMRQLLHLKAYERPEAARMHRNRQNIMRQVRALEREGVQSRLFPSLTIEMPWFFTEPRYGIALLFVAFAALHFLEAMNWKTADKESEIYGTGRDVAVYPTYEVGATNRFIYPALPEAFRLFPEVQEPEGSARFVGRLVEPSE